jgi:Ran binding protein in the microtubule-organising centre.
LSNPKNDVEIRGLLRQIIFTGNIKEAKEFLRENKPDMLNDELCMLYLAVQEFIELIKINEFYQALDFARDRLGKYKKYQVFVRNPVDTSIFVWEIVGLLAYNNPFDSPLCSLLSSAQLELTADLVNTRIIENSGSKVCILENFLKQALGIQYLYQENIMMVKPSNISIIN